MAKRTFLVLALLVSGLLRGQDQAAPEIKRAQHNVRTATTLALIPGAGQIYNGKYWKAPLFWGGMGGAGYYFYTQNRNFNDYKAVLQHMIDRPDLESYTDLVADRPEVYANLPLPFYRTTADGVAQEAIGYMENYRTQREYAAFGTFAVYLLSILDANIDAHLYRFDVSDDLSLSPALMPSLRPTGGAMLQPGIHLTLSLP